MTLNIDIKRTGFPVMVEGVELFFDASIENLRRFFDVEALAQEKLKEAQEKARHIHFPEVVEDIEDVEVETVDAAIDVNKEFIAAQYDIIFGDGAFKKVYAKHPDVMALESALVPIGIGISKKIDEMEAERRKEVESKKDEYLKKKAQKR